MPVTPLQKEPEQHNRTDFRGNNEERVETAEYAKCTGSV